MLEKEPNRHTWKYQETISSCALVPPVRLFMILFLEEVIYLLKGLKEGEKKKKQTHKEKFTSGQVHVISFQSVVSLCQL